ncbi:YhbY family RNA-binding protein [Accumulibacter sp.]|uniref:YhbY family RNA-binding protein n=1 Tax=Accumulibacter sp. TaxID=2053492 RepID=UPI00262446C3|nr:YhbY family RNA-binding protein [Accumulibacter sp.]
MLSLSSDQRRVLRARAHALQPVASISFGGLSESVVKEIDSRLLCHQLIKIRIHHGDRQLREQFLGTLCERLQAAPVQHIGRLLVIWRPLPEGQEKAAKPRVRQVEPRRGKRRFQGEAAY